MRLASFAALMILGCGPASTFDDVDPKLYASTPTYSGEVEPIVTRYCAACHSSTGIRAGGVELDNYDNLKSGAVKDVCVAIDPILIERYKDDLLPAERNPAVPMEACGRWKPYSMPTGAKLKMTPSEQVIFVRWLVTGAAP